MVYLIEDGQDLANFNVTSRDYVLRKLVIVVVTEITKAISVNLVSSGERGRMMGDEGFGNRLYTVSSTRRRGIENLGRVLKYSPSDDTVYVRLRIVCLKVYKKMIKILQK